MSHQEYETAGFRGRPNLRTAELEEGDDLAAIYLFMDNAGARSGGEKHLAGYFMFNA